MDACEVNVTSDVNNCGSCGHVCSNNNGTPTCLAGVCAITCAAGFYDCNGLVSDGCEANLANDPQHCGGCSTVCNGTNSGGSANLTSSVTVSTSVMRPNP